MFNYVRLQGAEAVKKKNGALHGDLFLIRHLLILREQLVPFETNLTTTSRHLDFSPTANAMSHHLKPSSLLRFDGSNGLIQFALHGLPSVHDTFVDSKKEIDRLLKLSCLHLKQSAIKMILGPVESLLAKVAAFTGDSSLSESGGTVLSNWSIF